jgi:hypothetical protein
LRDLSLRFPLRLSTSQQDTRYHNKISQQDIHTNLRTMANDEFVEETCWNLRNLARNSIEDEMNWGEDTAFNSNLYRRESSSSSSTQLPFSSIEIAGCSVPNQVWMDEILSRLSPKELISMSSTNSSFRTLIFSPIHLQKNSTNLWVSLFFLHFCSPPLPFPILPFPPISSLSLSF